MKRASLRSSLHFILRHILAIALLQLTLTSIGFGQDLDTVSINGRVTDQDGASIPGATVEAVLLKTGLTRTSTADDEGRYRLIQLEPGTYTLRFSSGGFATQQKTDLTVVAGQTVHFEVVLLPQSITAAMVVVTAANAAAVDTTRTVVGGTVTAKEIEQLPIASRSPLDLIFTLPGVTEEPLSTRDLAEDRGTSPMNTPEEAGSFSLAGGPAYSNNITIDGLDNNDDRSARERIQPSVEAIEEIQIVTNQFSAEYGRASGGRINLRTRGGSTGFRGRLFYFFRDEALDANTFRNKLNGLRRLPLQEHDSGFTLSGPIRVPGIYNGQKRTFVFAADEYDKFLDTTLIDTLVPVQQNPLFPLPLPTHPAAKRDEIVTGLAQAATEGIAPFISPVSTPHRNHILTVRVDHKYREAHNGTLTFQRGRLINLRQFGGGNRLAAALLGKTRNSDAISYTDNYVWSARLVNQVRFQYSRLTPAIEAQGGLSPVLLISIKDSLPPPGTTGTQTVIAGSSTSGATDRREQRIQLQDVVSYAAGAHSLRFGADLNRIKSTFIDLSDISGTFSFASAGDFLASAPDRYRQNFAGQSTQRNTYLGVFGQDEWRLRTNITFSLGLRWEDESIIRDLNNFAPRIAAAYDPFNSGKTVIRVGAGVFYNRALLRTLDDFTLGQQQLFFDTNVLVSPATGKVMTDAERRAFIRANLHFPQTLAADSALVKQFGILNTNFTRRLDPSLRIPESYQANLGFERELGKRWVFEANYTWNRGIHLWREFNANAPVLPRGFKNFTEYLASRDFPNFRNSAGIRPLYTAAGAGDLLRFVLVPANPSQPNDVVRITEFGVPVSVINLNSFTSGTAIDVSTAALASLRPDPAQREIEQLIPVGNSFYSGLTLQLQHRLHGVKGLGVSFRTAYTLSHLVDDGVVNTSDALVPGAFQNERSLSLQDRRHRFVFSGAIDIPRFLGKLQFAPVFRLSSGAPFNISAGGVDRNLDGINNDRPIFTGDTNLLKWRPPFQPIDTSLLNFFALPTIGQSGNLPRNAGHGPGQFLFDLNVTREFQLSEKVRVRPVIEFDNILNKTVFSFGGQFIDFGSALGPTATAELKSFFDSFLVTTRTMRPRQIRLGVRFDF